MNELEQVFTTIRISHTTKESLIRVKRGNDTYDSVINKMLLSYAPDKQKQV